MTEIDGLDVYLHGEVAGFLERRSQARLRFAYGEDWVADERQALSLSLPVRHEPFDHDECAPFFEGLLPEGDFLEAIARTLHISAGNPFQLLTELGGECAGAISVAPAGGPPPGQDPRPPRWLSDGELGSLLADLPRRPLIAAIDEMADGGGFRLSIAGAQDKVGVLVDGDAIGLSYGNPPTTGILKAPIPHVSESVANEAFCMSLAAHIDLDVAAAIPRRADSDEYLLVHRYDRSREARDGRLHQEDFWQALGLVPAVKYEKEGGPTAADCARLIRRHCSAPARDIATFLDALLFNFAIANYDAHSKNYSLLLDGPGSIRLAPLYDLISTVVFAGTDRKLAMRYGGENRAPYLRGRHLDRLAQDLGVKSALVRRRAGAMRERIDAAAEDARRALPAEFQDRPILDRVIEVVAERGETIARRASEVAVPPGPPGVEESALDGGSAAEAVSKSLASINRDLEMAVACFRGPGSAHEKPDAERPERAAREERLREELSDPARNVKTHGREFYDAVVDFDLVVEDTLDSIADRGGGERHLDPSEREFLDSLENLAASAGEGLTVVRELHRMISKMDSPTLRTPVRNMRAGLREMADARRMIIGWRRRAELLLASESAKSG